MHQCFRRTSQCKCIEKPKNTRARDRSASISIVYWVQQYVLNKWHNAAKNRKKETSKSLPGLYSHGSTTPQILNNNGLIASTRDIERVSRRTNTDAHGPQPQTDDQFQLQVSDASSESHDLDGWNPYQDSESDEMSPDPVAVANSTPSSSLSQRTSTTMVPYTSPDAQESHANNDPSRNTFSSMPAANNFRSRTYSPVTFQAEIYPRITFLIGPSYNRDGHTRKSYARIMGLEEAQNAETFRAGVFERLGEIGEAVGSRKVVAKPDWMSMPFVVDTDHDHHYLLETLRSWGEWKVPGLCVVYVSLEDEV